ncbi:MAG: hypothetical protein HUJ98_04495 [Bacteroidaceae bacterium]|nr:hypothetical protein [Bacteroidaceae bacterium]
MIAQRDELSKQIELLKLRYGLMQKKPETPKALKPEPKAGSIGYIESQIRDVRAKMELEVVGGEEWIELRKQLAELTDREFAIRLQMEGCDIKSETEKLEAFKA